MLHVSVNACERGVATQGPFTSDLRNAHMAIDGNTDQTSNYASVQDRKETGTAWWVVDLQYRRTIVNLTVLWANPGIILQVYNIYYQIINSSATVSIILSILLSVIFFFNCLKFLALLCNLLIL